jgi:hypothetical protein
LYFLVCAAVDLYAVIVFRNSFCVSLGFSLSASLSLGDLSHAGISTKRDARGSLRGRSRIRPGSLRNARIRVHSTGIRPTLGDQYTERLR